MKQQITIKDIAKQLGVHHSTVSRALSGDSRIKKETQERICKYAEEHDYVPNANALSFRDGKQNIIALIVPNVNHSFFSNIISFITNYANEEGYIIAVFQSNEHQQEEKNIIHNIIRNRFAGVIASLSMQSTNISHFKQLEDYNIPLVLFDRVDYSLAVSKVIAQDRKAVYDAVNILKQKGYQRIAFLGGSQDMELFRERKKGYLDGLSENDYQNFIEIKTNFFIQTGKEIIEELMQSATPPDAIISNSFNLSLGAYLAAKKNNWIIPEKFGLISFGSSDVAKVLTPSISIIQQPEIEFAKESFNLLLRQLKKRNTAPQTIEIPLKIILRESC